MFWHGVEMAKIIWLALVKKHLQEEIDNYISEGPPFYTTSIIIDKLIASVERISSFRRIIRY